MSTRAIQRIAIPLRHTRIALLTGSVVLMVTFVAEAVEILSVPQDITPPYYARVGMGNSAFGELVFHDDQYGAIPFYRDPNTVPTDFNLLDFFDFRVRNVREGFLMEGFQIHKGPGPAPIHSNYKSNGIDPVPIWFAPWSELETALEDGLYIDELSSLENLTKGNASFFTEILNPPGTPVVGEAAKVANITMNARGILEDGTTPFLFHVTAGERHSPRVLIDFQSDATNQDFSAAGALVPEPAGWILCVPMLITLWHMQRRRAPWQCSADPRNC